MEKEKRIEYIKIDWFQGLTEEQYIELTEKTMKENAEVLRKLGE